MAKLIDADALISVCRKTLMTDVFPNWRKMPSHEKNIAGKIGEMFKRIITNAPTVDAVEVVRCKDCKWRKHEICKNAFGLAFNGEDDFCSYGERKGDGNA